MKKNMVQSLAAVLLVSLPLAGFAASNVTVMTPYLAQPGTQFYVEGFEDAAKSRDWDVWTSSEMVPIIESGANS